MWIWSLGQEDPLEKEMATHSRILAWEIPGTEEPGGLQSMGLQKSQTWLSDQTTAKVEITKPTLQGFVVICYTSQRRQWHPTPVLLPGKSHGRRILVGCSPWGCEESDTTERLPFHFSLFTFMHWRRKWQPTPVFLSGESQGRGSLVGCRLWGRTESDTTEAT